MNLNKIQSQCLRGGFAALWMGAGVLSFIKAIPLLVANSSDINPADARAFGGCLFVFLVAWVSHFYLFMKEKKAVTDNDSRL